MSHTVVAAACSGRDGSLKVTRDGIYVIWISSPVSNREDSLKATMVFSVASISHLRIEHMRIILEIGVKEESYIFDIGNGNEEGVKCFATLLFDTYWAANATEQAASSFPNLPPELRCMIYQKVFDRSGGHTEVSRRLKPPALLETCPLVRRETRKLWYCSQEYVHYVLDCDASLLRKWELHCRSLSLTPLKGWLVVTGQPVWSRLVTWCKAIHGKSVNIIDRRDATCLSSLWNVVAGAHELAQQFRGRPWVDCDKPLKSYPLAAEFADKKWLD